MRTKRTNKVIAKLLIDKEMTLRDLANKIGKSYAWTIYVVNGHWTGTETRKDIARVLGARVEDLWDNHKAA